MTLAEYTDEIMFSLGGIGDNSVEIEIHGIECKYPWMFCIFVCLQVEVDA